MTQRVPINKSRLLARFLRYVQIDTTANPSSDQYPSSPGQRTLGKMLVAEMIEMGVTDAHQDENGLVWGTLPATTPGHIPTILFNAHLDTSPEASGTNVQPRVIENYSGGDIALAKSTRSIRVADSPVLDELRGQCLVTTDGTTLLGGDDKAGVAAIMELAQTLIERPHLPHGPVRILFTCDEEIGRGAKYMDVAKSGATAAYTLDGGHIAEVENENFSADHILVRAIGANIHPSIGKGKMINALKAICSLVSQLPVDGYSPETTEGRDGFVHPYQIDGGVGTASVSIILRDFVTEKLDDYAKMVEEISQSVSAKIPGIRFEIVRTAQYRNMADAMKRLPQVVQAAMDAHRALGQEPTLGAIRGGTDGAQFSAMGLPTPNLSVGQHNIHSELEFVSLDQMAYAVEHAIALLNLWQQVARN